MWLEPTIYAAEQEAYLACLGRTLALAQNFEHNVKFVFGTLDLDRALDDDHFDRTTWREYGRLLMRRQLGQVLKGREKDGTFSESEIEALEAGRVARNHLAHEAAAPALYVPPLMGKKRGVEGLRQALAGQIGSAAVEAERRGMLLDELRNAMPKFQDAVRALAEADNLVAMWALVIQEKLDVMPSRKPWYVATVVEWVFEPLGTTLR